MHSISPSLDIQTANALRNPTVPFAGCAVDYIGPLSTLSKGHRNALMCICLSTSYLIAMPLKKEMADKVSMAYIKEILPKTSCPKFISQDSGTDFKNEHLMSVFNVLGIKCIYGNPYYP